ncbi:hypothetical protein ACOGYG_000256 [Edwardsiella piscicida]|nr:hypothetical protein [Edwardsiella piscicida]UJT79741.1 hypothetical protein L1P06_03985 [Edwardsiella piscicida]
MVGAIAHDDRAVGDCRLGGAAGARLMVGAGQQAIGHIARELAANAAARAKAKPLVLCLELSAMLLCCSRNYSPQQLIHS